MNFSSIDIQGSILSADLLSKIRSEQANFQHGKDFNPDFNNAKLKDEISLAWQEAKGQWTIFKSKLKRLKEEETGTTETRNFWISPLLTNLGYNLSFNRQSEELNGKSFPIGYRDTNLDNYPVYVGGYHESLDKRPENKQLRVSPHALIQEYLNYSEHLYGLVTNGRQLRLLRDASRITRLSYVEFNLEKMMEEDLYSDFVILYRVLHASRMPKKAEAGAESIIEKYHQEGLEAGSTIRNKLGDAVKGAILNLANGFINHPNNTELRQALADGKINADEYYRHQLRIIYRLLFLFVIEERNLVYADSKTPETKRFAQIYYNYYSLLRLRKLAKKLAPPEAQRHYDLWQGLVSTFSLFEKKETGEKLGIMSLQGELFGYNAICGSNYDLHRCFLSNSVLLDIIKSLGYFENENHVLLAVNYGGLDVEEFGSVYEGLLELKLKVEPVPGSDHFKFDFDRSNERGKSGSHYTPEELVQPLIKHSLEYLIVDRIKSYELKKISKEATIQSLLNLKIADVACGSGHILLSAARRVALEIARVQTDEEQPNPLAIRKAMKDVVRNCIYGVDKNPLAVELCKIALWLEAYNPGEPLNFLDHHIKCGDAIVGLAHREELENGISDEAFKILPGDEKEVASGFAKQNKAERKINLAKGAGTQISTNEQLENTVQESMEEYGNFNRLPERTPDEIEAKQRAYKKFMDGKGFTFLKTMADTQVAQFFIPKTTANKDKLITDSEYRLILAGQKGWQGPKTAMAMAIAQKRKIFHWFLEFPEIFQQQGFDCILGNPPFLGGLKLSSNFGYDFLNYIHTNFHGAKATCDLVAYFFRRDHEIIRPAGFISLISTNSISQGDTRLGGLDIIVETSDINYAVKSTKWPGLAAVEVALVTIFKGQWKKTKTLNHKAVNFISAYLDDSNKDEGVPFKLKKHEGQSYIGSVVLGNGFIIDKDEATRLIEINKNNKEIIFEFINGDDLNSTFNQNASRFIINFIDYPLEICKEKYPEALRIIEEKVKPERLVNTYSKPAREKWWLYERARLDLYTAIHNKSIILATAITGKTLSFNFIKPGPVFSHATGVIVSDNYSIFSLLQSTIHEIWAWKNCSSMGISLRYTPSDGFQTFPFPEECEVNSVLSKLGTEYYLLRGSLTVLLQLGTTKIYNLFHSKDLNVNEIQKVGKQDNSTCQNAYEDVLKLRELHINIDIAVLEAYGWSDVELKHDFYEVDYLPENDRVRYTIHPDARKEVLKRLLELNHKIYEDEIKQGLHKEEDVVKFYEQKGLPVPAEVIAIMGAGKAVKKAKEKLYKKTKTKNSTVNEPEIIRTQQKMFDDPNLFSGEEGK